MICSSQLVHCTEMETCGHSCSLILWSLISFIISCYRSFAFAWHWVCRCVPGWHVSERSTGTCCQAASWYILKFMIQYECAKLVITLCQTTCNVADTANPKHTLKLLINNQLHGVNNLLWTHSNTNVHVQTQTRLWSGICVDAIPEYAIVRRSS